VHHCLTFRKHYTVQFCNEQEQHKVDAHLQKIFGSAFLQIQQTNYGLTISTLWEFLMFSFPLISLPLFYFLFGFYEMLMVIPILCAHTILSCFIHTWLHKSRIEINQQAPLLIKYFLNTQYGQFIIHHHYLHHRYPQYNFNLLWGGDWLLKVHRSPNKEDLKEISKLLEI